MFLPPLAEKMGSGEPAESPSSLDRTIEETLKEGQPSSIVTGIWLKSSISVRRCSIRYELTYEQLTTHFLWRTAERLELCGLVCAPTLCNRRVGCDGISHRRPSPWSPLPPRRCFLSGTACPGCRRASPTRAASSADPDAPQGTLCSTTSADELLCLSKITETTGARHSGTDSLASTGCLACNKGCETKGTVAMLLVPVLVAVAIWALRPASGSPGTT